MTDSQQQPSSVAAVLGSGCPMGYGKKDEDAKASAPEAAASSTAINPDNNMLIKEKQTPHPDQAAPLATDRMVSSIPKGTITPAHQDGSKRNWEYPSEQMFYNAMKRKGWKPEEQDMPSVVNIHNAVNEQSWRKLLEWEKLHSEEPPTLLKFIGRPDDISPKARIRTLFGHPKPFDRHDWVILRDNKEVRYVLDFYSLEGTEEDKPFAVHVDCRPALDSVGSVLDRVKMNFRRLLS